MVVGRGHSAAQARRFMRALAAGAMSCGSDIIDIRIAPPRPSHFFTKAQVQRSDD